ncbi:MAG: sensor histidine kinase [Betaproteobacteria bacterium]|jgi:two-component system sensor histidine kinase TctE|nr:sensor histidine kinase [Betaproteobacteria bacterium]
MRSSVRLALIKALALPILALLAGGAWFSYRVAVDVANDAYDQSLQNSALAIANRVRFIRGQLRVLLPVEAVQVLRTDEFDRVYFRVLDAQGRLITGDGDLPLPVESDQDDTTTFFDATYEGRRIRAVRLQAGTFNNRFYVTVAETMRKRESAVRRLLLALVLPTALIVVATGAMIWFGIARGLSPLRKIERELARRGGEDLSPVDEESAPQEVRLLVQALNGLLGRLREAAATQRTFLENAAHQLRTPLANLRLQLELLAREPRTETMIQQLDESVSRTIRLANQLLALARAESGRPLAPSFRPVNLGAVLDDLVDEWVRTADRKEIDLGFERADAWLLGDPFMLRELAANLIDNAVRYTQTGGDVTVRCGAADGVAFLEVEDNGVGIPLEERENVLERFYRMPGSPGSGSGLGLAIANDIVKAHAGSLRVAEPEGHAGTIVRAEFRETAQRPASASGRGEATDPRAL